MIDSRGSAVANGDMGASGHVKTSLSGPYEHKLATVNVDGVAMLCHHESGVRFFPGSHGFRTGPVHRYDKQGRNISVRYTAGASAIVSIYVFPFAPPRTAALFRDTFEASVADMLSQVHAHRAVDERCTAFAHAAADTVWGRRCEVAGCMRPGSNQLVHGIVELFVYRTWLLKIRATTQPASRTELESFLGAWLAASSFGNP